MDNTALMINRTPELIAAEINSIKQQARIQILCNSIEIGRRLIEVKEMLPHGEWGKWLDTAVDYSQSTANNLMRIAEEYGSEQWALFGADAKSQALGNLSYTQALALLALPAGEREQFAEENDIENMSTRELQKAIRERDEALEKAEAAWDELKNQAKELDKKTEENRKLQDDKKSSEGELKRLLETQAALNARLVETQKKLTEAQAAGNNEEAETLKQDLEEADKLLASANDEIMGLNKQIKELQAMLDAKPIEVKSTEVIEKIPEEVERELAQLRKHSKSSSAIKYKLHFESLINVFNSLLASLGEIQEQDPDQYSKYQHATLELISKMSERV